MSYRSTSPRADNGYTGLTEVTASLPAEAYFDPAWHARELRGIWYRSWIYLCRAESLPESGSFRTFTLGDQNLLLLRDGEGEIRAFHNTCRHRGSRLVRESEGRLKAKALACPYHLWLYNLAGELIRTPKSQRAPGFDEKDFPLYSVHLRNWRGFLFVCLGETPPPFEEVFDPSAEALANWPLDELSVGHREEMNLACNWKIFWENFNECYHCPHIHPELSALVPIYGRGISSQKDDAAWEEHAGSDDPKWRGGVRPGATSWSTDGLAQGAGFPDLTEAQRRHGQLFQVGLPNLYLVGHADYVRVVSMMPLGPEQTRLTVEWFFAPASLADPGFDKQRIVDFGLTVIGQDGDVSELNQQGLKALPHRHGVLMPQEYALKAFHDWIADRMAGQP